MGKLLQEIITYPCLAVWSSSFL